MEGEAAKGRGGGGMPLMAGGHHGWGKERGNGPQLNTAVTCLNWQAWGGKEGRGRGGAERIPRRAAAAGAGARKKKGRERWEADRWGPPVGAAEKEKEKGGKGSGPAGLSGPKRGKARGFSFFFLFLFQTSFSKPF
jgi:hypothetical protein